MKEIRQTNSDRFAGDSARTKSDFWEQVEEFLNSMGVNPILDGCSDSSMYFRIEAGVEIDTDGDEEPLAYFIRFSDHERKRNMGLVDFEVDYEWDGDDIVMRAGEVARLENWINKKKAIVSYCK